MINLLSANPTKSSNTQTIRRMLQPNYLNVFDHFLRLTLKELKHILVINISFLNQQSSICILEQEHLFTRYYNSSEGVTMITGKFSRDKKHISIPNLTGKYLSVHTHQYFIKGSLVIIHD